MSNIEIRKIKVDPENTDELYGEARGIKEFVYQDFLRVGASEREARSFADPDDEDQIHEQMDKMLCPQYPDTVYAKVLEDEEVAGYVKLGPRRLGDEMAFDWRVRMAARWREASFQPSADMPRGLHVLAVKEGLALAALDLVYYDLVPPSQALHASVHEGDEELNKAFTALGASPGRSRAVLQLGGYMATYVRRSLPPHKNRGRNNQRDSSEGAS